MSLTKEDKIKAVKISRAIEKYLHDTGQTMIRSTDVYEYLARNGLVPRDEGNGYYFRKFLKKLKREGALDLIPQCDGIDQDDVFTNWYFHSAGKKALKSVVIKQEKTNPRNFHLKDAIPVLRSITAGLNPLTGKVPTNANFINDRDIRAKLLLVIDHLEYYCKDDSIPHEAKGYSEFNERGRVQRKKVELKPMSFGNQNIFQAKAIDKVTQLLLEEVAQTISALPLIKETETLKEHMRVARNKYRRAYEPWSEEEDRILKKVYAKIKDTTIIADVFQRGNGSIIKRLKVLEVTK